MNDLTAITEMGSCAFIAGISRMQNPFYQQNKMPRQTGETFEDWQVKIAAWDVGWIEAESKTKAIPAH